MAPMDKATKKRALSPMTRAGGAYIPPAKLKLLQEQITDKSSEQYQRLAWEHLKKRIYGTVNKVNAANLVKVVPELLTENIIRGKGLFARAIIQAQAASPTFSNVFAALVAIVNSKFPQVGELIIRRLCIQFKRSVKRNDKITAISSSRFIAHLTNQLVVHEVLAIEILLLLLNNPTDDSVEIAVAFIKECGAKLTELSPRPLDAVFESFRRALGDNSLSNRIQYMIEVLFQIRKDKFKDHPSMKSELDLVEEDDQITHAINLDEISDPENMINVFRLDPEFTKNEQIYDEIRKEILGDDEENEEEEDEDEEDESTEAETKSSDKTVVIDKTEENLVAFRRTIYLVIQSSMIDQEVVHKLMKMNIPENMESELCHMILDCCGQQRTYENFYGLIAERLCRVKKKFQEFYEQMFKDTYDTIHRFEIGKIRTIARFFAHLLHSDAISWIVMKHIKLNEDDTTSSGRVFLKILFQELSEFMGFEKLYTRMQDGTLQEAFEGLLPRDDPHKTRFAINFFTFIGLGGLTVDLRDHLEKPSVTEKSSLKKR